MSQNQKATRPHDFDQILLRDLPPPPAVVYDIEGCTGFRARSLTEKGYRVHLTDNSFTCLLRAHLDSTEEGRPLAGLHYGDWRHIHADSGTADAVLLTRPLTLLGKREERSRVLAEVRRVLKIGGILFAHLAPLALDLERCFSRELPAIREEHFHCPDEHCLELYEAGFGPVRIHACDGMEAMLFTTHATPEDKMERLFPYLWNAKLKAFRNGGSISWLAVGIRR